MKLDISIMRHSCAHLVAAAVAELYPKSKFGVGPMIENGFYYDIDFGVPVTEDDLQKIEDKAKELQKQDLPFSRQEVTIDKAMEQFAQMGQDYKVELLNDLKTKGTTKINDEELAEIGGNIDKVTIYQTGNFIDLCRGPHLESTKDIGVFKLTKLAGAYWRGKSENPQLTRVYGVCFAKQKELDDYLFLLEEAEKRDHRKLGKELDLFHIDEMVGLGLPLWHPKGAIVWRVIEEFWYKHHLLGGYELVRTPHIGNKALWETSGHWGFYNDSMYPPLEVGQTLKESQNNQEAKEHETYLLKPMNCPFHVQIFKNRPYSYRELPLRWAECGTVYRHEKKGQLSGLTRVRGFTQDDAHIICSKEQVEEELKRVIDFILFIYKSFGFNIDDVQVFLSLRDPNDKEKYVGSDEGWELTESVLRKVAVEKKLNFTEELGEAAFYGPKLDFKIKDCLGRLWQCSTLQFDFNIPERFDMNFVNNKGEQERPYMLHRALFGSFERFIGLLIEHYAGAFPVWLAPTQIMLVPVSEKHVEGARKIRAELIELGLRVESDEADETLGNKVRKAVKQKVPYIIAVGDKELGGEDWMIRIRGVEKQEKMSKEKFIEKILGEVKERK